MLSQRSIILAEKIHTGSPDDHRLYRPFLSEDGSRYSGIIMMPTFDVRRHSELTFSSAFELQLHNRSSEDPHPRTDLCPGSNDVDRRLLAAL